MKRRVPSSLRLATLAAVAAAGLVTAPSALGAGAPSGLASNPVSPGNQTTWTFTWVNGVPDGGGAVTYEGGLVPGILDEPTLPLTSGATIDPPEGDFFFKVRSLEAGFPASAYTTLPVKVDRIGPASATISLSGPSGGVGGWFRAPLTVQVSNCSDGTGVGVAPTECADRTWTTEGFKLAGAGTITLTDLVGNASAIPIPQQFGFDNTRPLPSTQPGGTAPVAPGALVASEPTFEWTAGHGRDVGCRPLPAGLLDGRGLLARVQRHRRSGARQP